MADESTVDDSKLKLPTDVKLADEAVSTGEENEEVIFTTRGKYYRQGEEEWKERALGAIKFLKHKETGAVRIVVRQDKTFKVMINHLVNPANELKPAPGTDKFAIYTADDFADGEVKHEMFMVKVKNAEMLAAFTTAYTEAQTAMKTYLESGGSPTKPGAGAGAGAGTAPSAGAGAGSAPAAGGDPVSTFSTLSGVYGEDRAEAQAPRYAKITEAFKTAYGSDPAFLVRAPGRVNIIGEHVDYHGYSVLPCALENDVVIAVGVTDKADTVAIQNVDSAYEGGSFSSDPSAPVDRAAGLHWWQYVQCGYKGAFEAATDAAKRTPSVGLQLMLDGTVPPAAGVSSSSAVVVASTLAAAEANGIKYTPAELAEASRKTELHIGTMSGGMDQAISCLGKAGTALHIEFNPLRAHPVALPAGGVCVIANSLVKAAKAANPAQGYNCRVTEGKLAAKLIAKKAGLAEWATIKTVLELQKALKVEDVGDLVDVAEKHLKEDPYTTEQLTAEFGVAPTAVFEDDPKKEGALGVLAAGIPGFYLLQRARHVAAEAARVWSFRSVCEGEPSASQLPDLGELMNESHESCSGDYECSHPQLDELVQLCQDSGAYGARLTGAGWGGCAVSLVPESRLESFLKAVQDGFYATKEFEGDISTYLFASKPCNGAAIYRP